MKYKTLILTFIISNLILAQTSFTGNGIIGRGYDVFGYYANNKSIKRYPIFNFGATKPSIAIIDNISDHHVKTIEGSSVKEYTNKLSSEMGLSGDCFFFKASMDYSNINESNGSTSYFFYNYMDVITKWRVSLDLRDMSKLSTFLDATFKKDIETMVPKKLFETYGTHFISSAYIGGRADFRSVSEINEYNSKEKIRLALNGEYKMIKGGLNDESSNSYNISSSIKSQTLAVTGGSSEFTNSITNKQQYQSWVRSISENPVLSAFEKNSLIPIWKLTSNSTRQAALKKYYETVILANNPLPVSHVEDPILDNEDLVANYKVHVLGFKVHKACDYAILSGDQPGDFKFDINIYANNVHKERFVSSGLTHVKSGGFLKINRQSTFSMPYTSQSKIQVRGKLLEVDDLRNQIVGNKLSNHSFPFGTDNLYNYKTSNGELAWKVDLINSKTCNSSLFYTIIKYQEPTAIEYGNKGWAEYLKGNYDKALDYSKEALKIDNTLWYVQYNVCLLYLIQNNPKAFDKYRFISSMCNDKRGYQAALNDVVDYEALNGTLANSEKVKLLLKSLIK